MRLKITLLFLLLDTENSEREASTDVLHAWIWVSCQKNITNHGHEIGLSLETGHSLLPNPR